MTERKTYCDVCHKDTDKDYYIAKIDHDYHTSGGKYMSMEKELCAECTFKVIEYIELRTKGKT